MHKANSKVRGASSNGGRREEVVQSNGRQASLQGKEKVMCKVNSKVTDEREIV